MRPAPFDKSTGACGALRQARLPAVPLTGAGASRGALHISRSPHAVINLKHAVGLSGSAHTVRSIHAAIRFQACIGCCPMPCHARGRTRTPGRSKGDG
eukprot:1157374-Pelagomonas_calceolata.AAC.9